MDEPVVLISDPAMLGHDAGPGHPECPERLRAILEMLEREGRDVVRPAPASREQLALVHDASYVDQVLALEGERVRFDADTSVSTGSIHAAQLAAGAAVAAVDALHDETCRRAFAIVRPPGHHAERDQALGFCLFNNIAIAAAWARHRGYERVLIVDWDVHHGNGTQHIFERRDDVVFMSSHREAFYPGTGAIDECGRGRGRGATINLPLPAGVGDDEVVALYEAFVPAIAERFPPDIVLVSAGFDAHERDPLGGLTMTTAGFAALTGVVRTVAERWCGGRFALILEGGYDPVALCKGVEACRGVMAGGAIPAVGPGSEDFVEAYRSRLLA